MDEGGSRREVEHLSLRQLCEGNLKRGSFTGALEDV
jgi:hypothetical protein